MNLFKKSTAAVALVTLVSSVFTTGVSAYSTSEIEAANTLAQAGVIVDQSANPAAYNLDQNVLRQEIAAVARGIAGLDKKTTCDGVFTDVSATTPNTWACYSVEALADAGLIAKNAQFRPEANISKAEAVGMVVKAAFGDAYAYDASKGTTWQEQVVAFAVANGIVSNFTNYDTAATRGFVFEAGANAMSSTEDEEMNDIICTLLGTCGTEEDNTSEEDDNTTVTTPVVTGGNVEVSLNPSTPKGSDLPNAASGVPVLKFDITAGSQDATVTGLSFERMGFGDSAVVEIAAYSDNGRISKSDDFNSDDVSELTLTDFVVKAGSTETITILANTDDTATGEFMIELTGVTSSANVQMDSVVSAEFDVKEVDAVELTVSDEGVNANISSGEKQADLAEFKLDNEGNGGPADIDVSVTSITLREVWSVDQDTVLSNLTLHVDGKAISTVSSMNGKYVTFNFPAVLIEEGKSENFKLTADVNGGAGEAVQFKVDDAMDIQATASKYNAVSVMFDDQTFGSVSVDAGEVTIYSVDAPSDEIKADKDNVVLGQLKIVNTSGKSLELQDVAFNLNLTTTWGASFDSLGEVFENVEMVVNNSTEDLDAANASSSGTLYSQVDLGISIPEGTTFITVRADTAKNVTAGVTVEMTLDADDLVIEETVDDEVVDDITPSSLTWDEVEFVDSSVTVSNVPLADVSVVKGTSDIVALQFEIEAGSSSAVVLDKVLATITASGSAASNDEITSAKLYKGSVSDSNLLDQVSGSKLSASGVATFDGFEVSIAADATQTFIVTVSLADNDDIAGMNIVVSLQASQLELEDSDNDPVVAASAVLSDKVISVMNSWTLALTYDSKNNANKDVKTVLAGTSSAVVSYDIEATNEEIDVETVVFTVTSSSGSEFKNAVTTADLMLDGVKVATASNSKVVATATGATITFDNLTSLVVPTESTELELSLNTATIWFEKVGSAVIDAYVTSVVLSDAKWVLSNEDVSDIPINNDSLTFSVVPSVVTPSVFASLANSTTPQIQINANAGSNSEASSKSTPLTYIDTITFSLLGTTDANTSISYELVNVDDSTDVATWVVSAGQVTFDLSADLDNDNRAVSSGSYERFKVVITWATTDADTVELTLAKDGITYTVTGEQVTTNLLNEIEFGSRTY